MKCRHIIFATLVSVAAYGCAGAPTPEPQPAPPITRPDAATVARLEALYQARADSALSGYHAADVHFMTGMIGHHAQALVMSGFAPGNGASPTIQTLCARIINAQKDEIDIMQAWLRDRGLEVPEIHIADGHLMIHGPEHAMHMPGMLTQEQLDELGRAQGAAFDRLFLKYMIMHHRGAVTMVLELFATDGAAQDDFVFKLASDIQADQGSEITRMEFMLGLPELLQDAGRADNAGELRRAQRAVQPGAHGERRQLVGLLVQRRDRQFRDQARARHLRTHAQRHPHPERDRCGQVGGAAEAASGAARADALRALAEKLVGAVGGGGDRARPGGRGAAAGGSGMNQRA